MRLKMVAKANIPGVRVLMQKKGLDANGAVQKFHTNNVNNRIGKYMQAGNNAVMATKKKMIKSPTEIIVLGPYAKMQYFGKVMIDPKINAAGFMTTEGWRSRKGSVKVVTSRDMVPYTGKHRLAGPYWDRRLLAAEGPVMKEDIVRFVKNRR